MEGFVEIKGFSSYKVNKNGDILSPKGFILKNTLDSYGYYVVSLFDDNGIKKQGKPHRVVALTFILNPENKATVNHINGIKTDNRVENLEWCSALENYQHAIKTGLLEKSHGPIRKPVIKCDLEGNELEEYPSIHAAHKENNIGRRSIFAALRGEYHKAGGFKWKYK